MHHSKSSGKKKKKSSSSSKRVQQNFDVRPCQSIRDAIRMKKSCCKLFTNVFHPSKCTAQISQAYVCFSSLVTLHHEPEGVCKHSLNTGPKGKRYSFVKEAQM